MKKFLRGFTLVELMVVIAIVSIMSVIAAPPALADQPFRSTISVVNSNGSYTVAGQGNSLFFAQKIQAFIFKPPVTTNATTYTAYYVVGAVTNSLGTKTVTATDTQLTPTNMPWLLVGDKVVITTTESGTNLVYAVGEEK